MAPVIPLLEPLGHRAIAVDLPCPDPAATLDDYARTVVEAMAGIEGPVVVVGHSAGGATISLVPGRTRVDRLVYVTAVVPEPERSIADVVGADVRETMLSVSHDDGNGCRSFTSTSAGTIYPFRLASALAEPDGIDAGGTIVGPSAAAAVLADVERAVDEMVTALLWGARRIQPEILATTLGGGEMTRHERP